MCGIFGYVGPRETVGEVVDGLKRLEYRGYDSAGIAVRRAANDLAVMRAAGKVQALADRVQAAGLMAAGGLALGHTRWATHGGATENNAHPHKDQSGGLALVHNGIIENHVALRRQLTEGGHTLHSETDTELVAHLVGKAYDSDGDLLQAVRRTLPQLEGAYAFAAIHQAAGPEQIIVARKGSPLAIGLGDGEAFLASDIAAFLPRTRQAILLEDGDVARIERGVVQVWDAAGQPVERAIRHIEWSANAAQKDGFPHYMLKEIVEQPRAVHQALAGRVDARGVQLPVLDELLAEGKPSRIILSACGTSHHASRVSAHLFEQLARVPVEVAIASEIAPRLDLFGPETLFVSVSQSGETADTLAAQRAAQKAGLKTLAICNVLEATLAREADAVVYTQAGPEIAVASTKAFTTQLAVLGLVALRMADLSAFERAQWAERLRELPDLMGQALAMAEPAAEIAAKHTDARAWLFLGRNACAPLADEAALKLEEIAYVPAKGLPAAEVKHGPIAMVEPTVPSVVIAPEGPDLPKLLNTIEELKARKGPVIAVAPASATDVAERADAVLPLPPCHPLLAPLVAAVPLQLLAYHVADQLGRPIDQPRNLAKSVTVE